MKRIAGIALWVAAAAWGADTLDPEAMVFHKYLEAAHRGDPYAQWAVALRLERGHGVRANPALAATWYAKAAGGAQDPELQRLALQEALRLARAGDAAPPEDMTFNANPCAGPSARFLSTCR